MSEWKRYDRIITCKKHHLESRCIERGYTMEEVADCVVKRDGDDWTIDTMHPAYPLVMKPEIHKKMELMTKYAVPPSENGGPGTELKKLLKMIGITSSPTCSCNTKARIMDDRGINWCKNNEDTIVSWLEEEAKKRRLPFMRIAGKKILRMAIRAAEKKQNEQM